MKVYFCTSLFCLLLAALIGLSRGKWIREVNHISRKRLIWKKVATICMRRDVVINYKVRYNADRGCCPKFLLYSDEQYQRLIFLKGLEIMKENESAKKMGWSVRERIIPKSPNRKRRSVDGKYLSQSHLNNFVDNVPSSYHWRELEEFAGIGPRLKRSVPQNESNITYTDVVNRLYNSETSFFKDAESRLKAIYSCSKANRTMKEVLDPTQVIKLCPSSGISIASNDRAVTACEGTIKPLEQILLPNMTSVESWFGHGENDNGSSKQSYWEPNTWHIILYNCPGSPPLNISYVIDFDIVTNLHKTPDHPDYVDPGLEKKCSQIVLPAYNAQDGIPEGAARCLRGSVILTTLTTAIALSTIAHRNFFVF